MELQHAMALGKDHEPIRFMGSEIVVDTVFHPTVPDKMHFGMEGRHILLPYIVFFRGFRGTFLAIGKHVHHDKPGLQQAAELFEKSHIVGHAAVDVFFVAGDDDLFYRLEYRTHGDHQHGVWEMPDRPDGRAAVDHVFEIMAGSAHDYQERLVLFTVTFDLGFRAADLEIGCDADFPECSFGKLGLKIVQQFVSAVPHGVEYRFRQWHFRHAGRDLHDIDQMKIRPDGKGYISRIPRRIGCIGGKIYGDYDGSHNGNVSAKLHLVDAARHDLYHDPR